MSKLAVNGHVALDWAQSKGASACWYRWCLEDALQMCRAPRPGTGLCEQLQAPRAPALSAHLCRLLLAEASPGPLGSRDKELDWLLRGASRRLSPFYLFPVIAAQPTPSRLLPHPRTPSAVPTSSHLSHSEIPRPEQVASFVSGLLWFCHRTFHFSALRSRDFHFPSLWLSFPHW